MHLVIDQVVQLQHVDVADRRFLFERLTRSAIHQTTLAMARQPSFFQAIVDFRFGRAVEDRRDRLEPEFRTRPA